MGRIFLVFRKGKIKTQTVFILSRRVMLHDVKEKIFELPKHKRILQKQSL